MPEGVIACPDRALTRGNTMRKKGALLGSVLAVTVSSAPALATDFNTPTGLQGTTPSPLQNAVLGAKEGWGRVLPGFGPQDLENGLRKPWGCQ